MPGTELMPPPDDNRIVLAIGLLQSQVSTLTERVEEMAERTTVEHRKVHDIVVAQSESMRNVARDVVEMKPHVEAYKMKAASIDEAVSSARKFEVDQAEKRGAERFKNWIYGLAASVGGIIAFGLGKLIDLVTSRPHIPVIVVLVGLLAIGKALAQERHHPVADVPLHERFYSNWFMPDDPAKSCCSSADCYPTVIRYVDGVLFARRREDGRWLLVPAAKIERRRDNPDGRNHLCAPPPGALSYPADTVFCFSLGSGT